MNIIIILAICVTPIWFCLSILNDRYFKSYKKPIVKMKNSIETNSEISNENCIVYKYQRYAFYWGFLAPFPIGVIVAVLKYKTIGLLYSIIGVLTLIGFCVCFNCFGIIGFIAGLCLVWFVEREVRTSHIFDVKS